MESSDIISIRSKTFTLRSSSNRDHNEFWRKKVQTHQGLVSVFERKKMDQCRRKQNTRISETELADTYGYHFMIFGRKKGDLTKEGEEQNMVVLYSIPSYAWIRLLLIAADEA